MGLMKQIVVTSLFLVGMTVLTNVLVTVINNVYETTVDVNDYNYPLPDHLSRFNGMSFEAISNMVTLAELRLPPEYYTEYVRLANEYVVFKRVTDPTWS